MGGDWLDRNHKEATEAQTTTWSVNSSTRKPHIFACACWTLNQSNMQVFLKKWTVIVRSATP